MTSNYIAIAGNIGSGKSSLVEFLSKHFHLKPFHEAEEVNPFLTDFYKDMRRWAFHSQIYFLTRKFRMHLELGNFPETMIVDRSLYEDAEVFAENLFRQESMSRVEYRTYRDLYEKLAAIVQPPKVLIYLECPVRILSARIKKRGRSAEKTIPVEYLQRLHRYYTRWIDRYDLSPVVRYSTAHADYLSDFLDRDDLFHDMERHVTAMAEQ